MIPYKYIRLFLFVTAIFICTNSNKLFAQNYSYDTLVVGAVIYNGDTIEAKTLAAVSVLDILTQAQKNAIAKWTRLRNAVYVTYPYANKAGQLINDINSHLLTVTDKVQRKEYIQSREKELKKEFSNPITNLSIYQGKVLMKLINRETGNNCYDIIKEYKGGFTARLYQTVAFFFDGNLKQPYDASGEDAEIEKIVLEVRRMYGYPNKS